MIYVITEAATNLQRASSTPHMRQSCTFENRLVEVLYSACPGSVQLDCFYKVVKHPPGKQDSPRIKTLDILLGWRLCNQPEQFSNFCN